MAELDAPAGSTTGPSISGSLRAFHNIAKVKATIYMYSRPGPDDGVCNTSCHSQFDELIKGTEFEFKELSDLNAILDYRLEKNKLGELYCYALDIGIPEGQRISDINDQAWRDSLLKRGRNPRDKEDGEAAVALLDRYEAICKWIREGKIFDPPSEGQGSSYVKPNAYLAIRLAETEMALEEIKMKLENLRQLKLEQAKRVASSSAAELQYRGKKINIADLFRYIIDCLQRTLA
ncbi:hypothetical protein HYALB_00006649 [Hymenoscyphus albidus]|uniref:Uncharacterized protein n=1 Tax=Hymenoscyphus albidus TaxID=595503 RepID=A0A9N9M2D1_9HELO|nr:hypothetical protein HYALB_00006649 [Hymenoscyphus albidus]